MSGLRSVRAALMIALTWAIPWMVGGVAVNVFSGIGTTFRHQAVADIIHGLLVFAAAWAIIGAVNGLLFSLLLSTIGKRWRGGLNGLSVAVLGALAGSILPMAFFALLMPRGFTHLDGAVRGAVAVIALCAALGGLLGIATFAAARHNALER